MKMWSKYSGSAQGTMVEGDKSVPPTRWYNHLWLVFFGWRVVTVFEVSAEDADRGYRIGYIPEMGSPMLNSEVFTDRWFRMKNGHEDCKFFAVDEAGNEVLLVVTARTTVADVTYANAPLH